MLGVSNVAEEDNHNLLSLNDVAAIRTQEILRNGDNTSNSGDNINGDTEEISGDNTNNNIADGNDHDNINGGSEEMLGNINNIAANSGGDDNANIENISNLSGKDGMELDNNDDNVSSIVNIDVLSDNNNEIEDIDVLKDDESDDNDVIDEGLNITRRNQSLTDSDRKDLIINYVEDISDMEKLREVLVDIRNIVRRKLGVNEVKAINKDLVVFDEIKGIYCVFILFF